MKALMLDEKDAIELYPSATPIWKRALEGTFGKDFFLQKITDRVKTFNDACKVLDIDPDGIVDESEESDEIAYKKLKVIVRALNEGWEANWDDGNQRKWYPWWYMNQPGFRLDDVRCVGTRIRHVGSRLVFKTEELAKHAADYFSGLYSDLYEL
jgi:hypothetical protein